MNAEDRTREVTALVEAYYADVYRYAYRLSGRTADAEDLTQQAFLTAQRKLDQLRDGEKAKAWLFAVVRNAYLKSRRKQEKAQTSLPLVGDPAVPAEEPAEFTTEELAVVVNELPDEFRIPLVLFYFENLSYRDIAAALSVPIGTVMSRLSRAKATLRQKLSADKPLCR